MRTRGALAFLFLLFLVCSCVQGIRWLSLVRTSSLAAMERNVSCDQLRGLSRAQKLICKNNYEFMQSVRRGAKLAVLECQHQFRSRRWNCSTVHGTRLFNKALSDVLAGTREAAFVHALSAAAVAHEVTRACSSGRLAGRCGCDRSVRGTSPEGFKWSGCSDNVAYGVAFSRSFVDARDLRLARMTSNPKALVNLHNNDVGRKVIRGQMTRQCKCHGVSGSCELKTCWKELRPFRDVGHILKEKFDSATEVQVSRPPGTHLRPLIVPVSPLSYTNGLQYLKSSPDFCEANASLGFLGTSGRRCYPDSVDGCQMLCCGRGYDTRTERLVERCACKFVWCCEVRCKSCIKDVSISTCH
ncbi:protein Wnt-4-like [Ornithodoros turicata]